MKRKLSGLAIKRRVLAAMTKPMSKLTKKEKTWEVEVLTSLFRPTIRIYRYDGQKYREEDKPTIGSGTITITRAKKGGRA